VAYFERVSESAFRATDKVSGACQHVLGSGDRACDADIGQRWWRDTRSDPRNACGAARSLGQHREVIGGAADALGSRVEVSEDGRVRCDLQADLASR
jgi:hypothetical protein